LPLEQYGEEVLGYISDFRMDKKHSEAIPTGLRCTNYRAEVQALIHAANTIKYCPTQLFADVKSVLKGFNKLSHLLDAL
jgi:ribonuclease HI